MTIITVRPVSEEDFSEVCSFEQGDDGCRYQAAVFVRQAMVLWPESFLVAELDGNLAGFLLFSTPSADPVSRWILRVRVSEGMRRQGVATAMLMRAHAIMEQAGVLQVLLSCSPANEGALALYSRMGYIRIRDEHGYFGPGEDRLILIKKV